ncbi:MAG: TlpA family protein disulfide reductase, partial [Candidatus Methylomirabilis sp.]|nr:TlpA family protein disulfide reductase [Deltaproteobacteria bacterium]
MTVPHIAVLDKKGVLRLRDGASLLQPVDGKTTLADYLRAGAAGEGLATVQKLDFYHPAVENVGQRFFEFKLTSFPDGREAAISDYVEPGKITALFFWSPKCPHCKEALPSVNRARAKYKDKVNFISVTQLPTAEAREACSEVMRLFRIDFPVLVDETGEASGAYKVVSTPTTVVIQPSGAVSACYFSGEADYERLFEAEIGKIAKTARP